MDAGRIVEEGTHDSLLAQGNIYAMLVKRQTGNAVDTARPRDDDKPSADFKSEVTQTTGIHGNVRIKSRRNYVLCYKEKARVLLRFFIGSVSYECMASAWTGAMS